MAIIRFRFMYFHNPIQSHVLDWLPYGTSGGLFNFLVYLFFHQIQLETGLPSRTETALSSIRLSRRGQQDKQQSSPNLRSNYTHIQNLNVEIDRQGLFACARESALMGLRIRFIRLVVCD